MPLADRAVAGVDRVWLSGPRTSGSGLRRKSVGFAEATDGRGEADVHSQRRVRPVTVCRIDAGRGLQAVPGVGRVLWLSHIGGGVPVKRRARKGRFRPRERCAPRVMV